MTSVDPTKFSLVPQAPPKKGEPQKYTLYQTSSEQSIAFCFSHDNKLVTTNAEAGSDEDSSFCNRDWVDRSLATQSKVKPPTEEVLPIDPSVDPSGGRFCKVFHDFMGDTGTAPAKPPKLSITMRSVGDMIGFLGDLTAYEENVRSDEHHHIPLKLGYCPAGMPAATTAARCSISTIRIRSIRGSRSTIAGRSIPSTNTRPRTIRCRCSQF